jgi:NAD(P)H-hydrate epimerase
VITSLEMRVLDANARHFGISILEAMERAGKGIADFLLKDFGAEGKRVVILVGTGNNGGDGLVAGHYLRNLCDVTFVLARGPDRFGMAEAWTNWERLQGTIPSVPARAAEEALANADIVVDALLGIGLTGEVRDPYRSLIEATNRCGKPVVAVDVPSGFGTDLMVRPEATVTMHDTKEGLTEANAGRVAIVDIGFTDEIASRVGPGDFLYYPVPRSDSHKGDRGRLLVLGGGPFTGAPALVARGALGIGLDVAHIATPERAWTVVASFSPAFIVHSLPGAHFTPEHIPKVLRLLQGKDALVLGPGLGTADETLRAVPELVAQVDVPVALDADALTAIAPELGALQGKPSVLTPHATEFHKLSGESLTGDPARDADKVRALANRADSVVLRKGPVDVISDGTSVRYSHTGNPGMTVGGTGDVLAGVVGGLLAMGVAPFAAARMAAYANGYAGDAAFRERSFGLTALDVVDHLPDALRDLLR